MTAALLWSCGAAGVSAPAASSQLAPQQNEHTRLTVETFAITPEGVVELAFVDEEGEVFSLPPTPDAWFANAVFLRAEVAEEDLETLQSQVPDYSSLERIYYVFLMDGQAHRILLERGASLTLLQEADGLYVALDENWQRTGDAPALEPLSQPQAPSAVDSASLSGSTVSTSDDTSSLNDTGDSSSNSASGSGRGGGV